MGQVIPLEHPPHGGHLRAGGARPAATPVAARTFRTARSTAPTGGRTALVALPAPLETRKPR
ncbi:hypothetical protein GCM10027440_45580 [Nocardiopsis coralliicola]